MTELLNRFAIKHEDNLLWNKYIRWLNEKYDTDYTGNVDAWYGFNGIVATYTQDPCKFNSYVTLLSLETWDIIVNGNKSSSNEI